MNRSAWVKNLLRPLAIGGMMGCIALSMVDLVRLFFPTWNGTYIVAGCVLAALEAHYSYRLIRVRELRGEDVLRFRAIEIAMMFILLRIGSYIGSPWSAVIADIRSWPREPGNIFDLEATFAFALAVLSWLVTTQTIHDLERIGEPPVRSKYYVPPIEALSDRFFWGGALLLITAGITRIGVAALLELSRPSVPGIVLNVLVYFVLGLVMLGQIQFTYLSQRWRKEGINVSKRVAGRWARYTLILLGVAALVAFLLPTGYTFPLLDIASIVVGFILYAFNLLFYLLLIIFFLLLTPLAMLLGRGRPEQPTAPPPPSQRPQLPPSGGTPAWFEIARSALFWVVALGIVVYVVRSYLRDRPQLVEALATFRPIRTLRRFLLVLWHQLTELAGAARERIPTALSLRRLGPKREGAAERRPFRFFRLGALSPRERTLYYYLSILRRAGRLGYPRRRSQTPYEYDETFGPNLPQAEEEMAQLTEAFVQTRYSLREVDRQQEERIRADWKRVREALRKLRQGQDATEASE